MTEPWEPAKTISQATDHMLGDHGWVGGVDGRLGTWMWDVRCGCAYVRRPTLALAERSEMLSALGTRGTSEPEVRGLVHSGASRVFTAARPRNSAMYLFLRA